MFPAMCPGYMFLLISFMTLLTCSREIGTDFSTSSHYTKTVDSSLPRNDTDSHGETQKETESDVPFTLEDPTESLFQKNSPRSNHSRMLLESTLGYEEWWYYTTRRPFLHYKDFPGRIGVATWKELSPGGSLENKKSRQMDNPTAAGVSSNSWSCVASSQPTILMIRVFCLVFFFLRFRLT